MGIRWKGLSRWLRGEDADIGGTVYGEIIVLSVIAAGADDDAGTIAGVAITTCVVFWLAHVYARSLTLSVEQGHRLTWSETRAIARHESAMLQAAVLPVAALLLGAFGVIEEDTAFWLAIIVGVVTLTGQALVFARIERLSLVGTATTVGINLAFGVAIIGLKVLVTH